MKRMLIAAVGVLVVVFAGCSGRGGPSAGAPTVMMASPTAAATRAESPAPSPAAVPTITRSEAVKINLRWRWDSGLFNVITWVRANGARVAASHGGLHDGQGDFSLKPGGVALLDAATGTELWRRETPTQAFPAAFAGGVVAAGTGDGTVFAWDEANGAERWRLSFDGIPFQVIPAAGVLVVADADPETWGPKGLVDKTRLGGRVWGVDPASGTVLWKESVGSFNAFVAVENLPTGGLVAVSSSSPAADGSTVVIEPETGKERWRKPLEASSPPAVEGSLLVVPGSTLRALDLTTGDERWAVAPPGGGAYFFPGISANAVVSGANTGSLDLRDARDGRLLATSRVGECVSRPAEWLSGLVSGLGLLCGSLVRLIPEGAGWNAVTLLTPQGTIDSVAASGAGVALSTGIGFTPEQVLFIEP